jgi:alkanesulfonate monooxygenase SsuD/methylene tetrahydromethanopterin reductase-like flavin-dependent oxidoreductase (luciferase family)
MSSGLKLGVQPLTYGLTWSESLAAAKAVDDLGYDYLWGHDHLYSTGGDPFQPFFEGWTTLAAWAAVTRRVRLGLLVGANPFRNPGVVAKMAATVDHISGGRLVFGLGAGNRELEVTAHGMDPGRSVGDRLDRLDEALTIVRALLEGETVQHESAGFATRRCRSRLMSRSSSVRPARRRACGSWPATPTSGRCGSPWTTSTSSDTSARSSTSTVRRSAATQRPSNTRSAASS